MLLFSLTLLLIVLMVCLTLSIATKAKEKMELQIVADTAAYSNAIVTARVFNEIALMNRAQTAQMVSMAGVQSLINWSSFHRAQLEAIRKNYNIIALPYRILQLCCLPFSGCGQFCGCARKAVRDISRTRSCIQREQQRIGRFWNNQEQAASMQVQLIQGAASALYGFELAEYGRLSDQISGQDLAQAIVRRSQQGAPLQEITAPGGADGPNNDEINPFLGAPWLYPILGRDHHISAAMGSRGFTFVTNRIQSGMVITSRLQELLGQCGKGDFTFATDTGESYFGKKPDYGFYRNVSGKFSWAVDRGANFTVFMRGQAPCPPVMPMARGVNSTLRSTDSGDNSDQHQWSPRAGTPDDEPPRERHDLLPCVGTSCPGMWPMFVDYNGIRVVLPDDNYGQPRMFATVQRDYRRRAGSPDPWNLLFRFRFNPSGDGQQYDPRGIVMQSTNGAGLDISKQTAVSTAIAYYHRGKDIGLFGSHWREPPNFLNPFWRATLVPSTVEGSSMKYEGGGDDDIRKALRGANVDWAADAHEALARAGFQGWQ